MSYTCTVTIVTGYGVLYGEGAGNHVFCKTIYSICRCAFLIFPSDFIQRDTASHINPSRAEQVHLQTDVSQSLYQTFKTKQNLILMVG